MRGAAVVIVIGAASGCEPRGMAASEIVAAVRGCMPASFAMTMYLDHDAGEVERALPSEPCRNRRSKWARPTLPVPGPEVECVTFDDTEQPVSEVYVSGFSRQGERHTYVERLHPYRRTACSTTTVDVLGARDLRDRRRLSHTCPWDDDRSNAQSVPAALGHPIGPDLIVDDLWLLWMETDSNWTLESESAEAWTLRADLSDVEYAAATVEVSRSERAIRHLLLERTDGSRKAVAVESDLVDGCPFPRRIDVIDHATGSRTTVDIALRSLNELPEEVYARLTPAPMPVRR